MNKYYAEENEIMYHTGLSKELIQNASYAVVPGIGITRLGLLM